jgi:hypothetical protein
MSSLFEEMNDDNQTLTRDRARMLDTLEREAQTMLDTQADYFRTRDPKLLTAAKAQERKVRQLLRDLRTVRAQIVKQQGSQP